MADEPATTPDSTTIRHRVDLSHRNQHLMTVTTTVPAGIASGARVKLATWTPGSYLLRFYVHHVQSIRATDEAGRPVTVTADGLTAWHLGAVDGAATITLEIYANDLSVRTNHVDDHHALVIPAATFLAVDGATAAPQRVEFAGLRDGDDVHGLLPRADDGAFVADDYLHLVDSAFEVGAFPVVDFTVDDVPHRFVWSAHSPVPDLDKIAGDVTAMAQAARSLFDTPLPMERYTLLCAGWDQGGGGLEHRDGAVLQIPLRMLDDQSAAPRFQALVAHEYFHVWNVKRLTPRALIAPDLETAVHTPSLWVAEGWTSYFDKLLPARAGVWKPRQLLDQLGDMRQRVLDTPGALLQALRTASHEAWTKHYIRDENSVNAATDYYGHGGVVAWEIDLRLRRSAPGGEGLDDVLRLLWRRHAGSTDGYTETDVLDAVATVGGDDLAQLLDERVTIPGAPAIDDELLAGLGLELAPSPKDELPDLGVVAADDDQGVTFTSVLRDRPAWKAGITGGDRLVAINGWTVGRGALSRALASHAPGDEIDVAVTRGPRLLHLAVTLGEPRPRFRIAAVDAPGTDQQSAFLRWCGWPLDEVTSGDRGS